MSKILTTLHHITAFDEIIFADQTECHLEDLDFIPTEKLFCQDKYKKMVNILRVILRIGIILITFSWLD